jgi:pimeloyl-ACP methyl ester carboxylesterase
MQSHLFRAESGASTHYIECGNLSGSLIILLHGLGGSTATFDALIPSIPLEKYRVIAVDFEGFGKSALCNKTISVERLVWNLSELIESLHQTQRPEPAAVSSFESPVIIVGHSLGSIIALHYAASKPDNVKSLGLIGAGRSASHISAARQRMLGLAEMVRNRGIVSAAELAMKTNFAADEENSPLQREAVRKAVAASDPEAYALTCEAIVDPSHKDPDYSKITCPTVFICGNGDTLSPPERSHDLKKLLGGSSEVSVVRGGHQPILSDLEGTKTAIARLFELVKDQ